MTRHAERNLFVMYVVALAFSILPGTGQAQVRVRNPDVPAQAQALPFLLKAVRVDPTSIAGGNTVQGTVELHQAPGPNGVTVTLESSHPQLVAVPPRVTITHGTASAETGPMVIKSFLITTQPVAQDISVTIKARAGVQTLEAVLRIQSPRMKFASLNSPGTCDGNNKGTVNYTLTGPAPSGFEVTASEIRVSNQSGYSSGSPSVSETVPTGNSQGSMRIALSRCYVAHPGGHCSISGVVRHFTPGSGGVSTMYFGGGCGAP